jgi:hypothetical protein
MKKIVFYLFIFLFEQNFASFKLIETIEVLFLMIMWNYKTF